MSALVKVLANEVNSETVKLEKRVSQLSLVPEKSLRVLSTPRLMNGLAGVPSLPRAWLRCRCCVAVSFLGRNFCGEASTLLLVCAFVISANTWLDWKSWLRGSMSTPSKSSALPMILV